MPDALPVAIADTSTLIAFFNAADNHHKPIRAGIGKVGHLVVSLCVLTIRPLTRHAAFRLLPDDVPASS